MILDFFFFSSYLEVFRMKHLLWIGRCCVIAVYVAVVVCVDESKKTFASPSNNAWPRKMVDDMPCKESLLGYACSETLGPLYVLHYTVASDVVHFAAEVTAVGWVALGFSLTGGMQNTDAVIGFPTRGTVEPYHLGSRKELAAVSPDEEQVITDTSIEHDVDAGVTVMKFSRPVRNGGNYVLTPGEPENVVYAFSKNDESLSYHGGDNRGAFELILSLDAERDSGGGEVSLLQVGVGGGQSEDTMEGGYGEGEETEETEEETVETEKEKEGEEEKEEEEEEEESAAEGEPEFEPTEDMLDDYHGSWKNEMEALAAVHAVLVLGMVMVVPLFLKMTRSAALACIQVTLYAIARAVYFTMDPYGLYGKMNRKVEMILFGIALPLLVGASTAMYITLVASLEMRRPPPVAARRPVDGSSTPWVHRVLPGFLACLSVFYLISQPLVDLWRATEADPVGSEEFEVLTQLCQGWFAAHAGVVGIALGLWTAWFSYDPGPSPYIQKLASFAAVLLLGLAAAMVYAMVDWPSSTASWYAFTTTVRWVEWLTALVVFCTTVALRLALPMDIEGDVCWGAQRESGARHPQHAAQQPQPLKGSLSAVDAIVADRERALGLPRTHETEEGEQGVRGTSFSYIEPLSDPMNLSGD